MPPEVKKLRQLQEENARLGKVVDDLILDKEMLQEVGGGPPQTMTPAREPAGAIRIWTSNWHGCLRDMRRTSK